MRPYIPKEWSDEFTVFTRAFAGASVLGIPLVFTMEMWWIGQTMSFTYLLVLFALGFIANLGLARVAGFRNEHSWIKSADQSIDALAVGIMTAVILLITLNQIQPADGLGQSVGMVMALAVPLSLGASVARELFSGRTSRQMDEEESDDSDDALSVWQGVIADVGATAIGGVFVGLSIAVTDEIPMIAAGITWWNLFAVMGISMLMSYVIVFASGFDDVSPEGPFQHPFTETILAYAISLLVAFGMLLLFERLTFDDPAQEMLRQTVVLALPATIGGAGGRLVI